MRGRAERNGTRRRTSPDPTRRWTAGSDSLELLREARLATLDGGALLRNVERRVREEADDLRGDRWARVTSPEH